MTTPCHLLVRTVEISIFDAVHHQIIVETTIKTAITTTTTIITIIITITIIEISFPRREMRISISKDGLAPYSNQIKALHAGGQSCDI